MVKFWSVALWAAVAIATCTSSVDGQNAVVHAANLPGVEVESRAAGSVAPASKSPVAPKLAASGSGSKVTVAPSATSKPALATGAKTPTGPIPASSWKAQPTAIPTKESPTWVENQIKAAPKQKACYRRVSLASNKLCAKGYTYDNILSCWSQCPLDYPVQCGFECIPQNKDCTLNLVSKATSVANTALSIATGGLFGSLQKAASGVQHAVACGQGVYDAVSRISEEVDSLTAGQALTTKDKITKALSSLDFVVYDVPAVVATCLGVTLPEDFTKSQTYLKKVEGLVSTVVDMKVEKKAPTQPNNFVYFYKSFKDFWGTSSAATEKKLPEITADQVTQMGKAATTCGGMLKAYFNKVKDQVADYIKKNPQSTVDKLEYYILNLPLVLNDLPDATVNCWTSNAPDGAKTRDEIITAARLITEQIVKTAKDGAKATVRAIGKYKWEIAQFGLDVIAIFDPYSIAELVKEFLMPICPVTEYEGLIQSGPLDKSLGLKTVSTAFAGSFGTWESDGDGLMWFNVTSVDTKDTKLNVMSGGKKIYEWPVSKGKTVLQALPMSQFAGKTLYLDRWRPGILNFLGTGGGSLLMWVPESTKGEIHLNVLINPTHMGDR